MQDLSKYKSYRYHSTMLYIDTNTKLGEIRLGCPLFFKNGRKGETYKIYKGHIISQYTEQFGDRSPVRKVSVYAYDQRTKNTYSLDYNGYPDLSDAKKAIDAKLKTVDPAPLKLKTKKITVLVPVTIEASYFTDESCAITNVDIEQYVHIGDKKTTQYTEPISTLNNHLYRQIPKHLKKRK